MDFAGPLVVAYSIGVVISYLTRNLGVTRFVRRRVGFLHWKGYLAWPVVLLGLLELLFGTLHNDECCSVCSKGFRDFFEEEKKKGEDEPLGNRWKGLKLTVTTEKFVSAENIRNGSLEEEEVTMISMKPEGSDSRPLLIIENKTE